MYTTRILPVPEPDALGHFRASPSIDHWEAADPSVPGMDALAAAADRIRTTDVPVGFPTETVYGLGADATRSAAVRGIFAVKGRPSDNPLIVHVCDLAMLRGLLGGARGDEKEQEDAIPVIYRALIARFWPGPLTILLPVPPPSPQKTQPKWTLAPQVTAGLATFGARLPASPLTRTLIRLAGTPLAGPSANASTRPSPTTAQHVVDDLAGRIELVLDGGACGVGVESTVVDGLCDPPVVLRPGGITLAELRTVPGWEHVACAYHDVSGGGNSQGSDNVEKEAAELAPRAPGMKYKHYSPKARVVLYEDWRTALPDDPRPRESVVQEVMDAQVVQQGAAAGRAPATTVGVIRTATWPDLRGAAALLAKDKTDALVDSEDDTSAADASAPNSSAAVASADDDAVVYRLREYMSASSQDVLELDLGRSVPSIAHGLFSALRDLDARGAEVILVEGIDDRGNDMAAAVMNRLRKAASEVRVLERRSYHF